MSKLSNFIKSTNRKSLKYGSISAILIIVVVAVFILINLIVNSLVTNNVLPLKWDLSANKLYSISDKTIDILKTIDKDVEIYVLYDASSTEVTQVKEVLAQYKKYSNRITVKYSDPDKDTGIISKIDPSGTNNVVANDFVVKCGNKIRVLTPDDIEQIVYDESDQPTDDTFIGEQSFTGAIKYVISDYSPVVYFTIGHGEATIDTDYTGLKKQLQSNNYDVKTLNLIASKKIPKDAEIILVGSPTVDLSVAERRLISKFLDNGGKVIFLFDYLDTKAKFPEFEKLLETYNIGIDYDKVKENDSTRYYPGNQFLIIANVLSTDIIKNPYSAVLLADSRSIRILSNDKSNLTITPLITTSESAVGIQTDATNGNSLKGPLNLAVAVENKAGTKPSKILVMGNGSFVSDAAASEYGVYYQYGETFFTQALNWMIDKGNTTVIDAKSYLPAVISISSSQATLILILTVVVLPLLIFGTGIFVWVRRRHR